MNLYFYDEYYASWTFHEFPYVMTSNSFLVFFLNSLNILYSFTAGYGIDFKPTTQKLEKLGLSYRPLEETFVDSVESYKKSGILD